MSQIAFEFPLNEFELATLGQLISYKCKDEADIDRLMSDPKNIAEARRLVKKWNVIRKTKKLKVYTQ